MEKLTSKFLDTVREQFEKSFYWACLAVFESQFPASWLVPHVHKPVCDLISNYRENRRVAITLPRDWLKSQVCSIYYPIWRAMPEPNFTSLLVQNTFTNATKKLGATRSLLRTNRLLQQLYPERMLTTSCKVSAEAICLPREVPLSDDTFEAAGVGTDVTGRHVDLITEDDTVAPEFDRMTGDVFEPSSEQVAKAIGFHQSLTFLLQDLENSQRLVVGTFWRELDLFSWMENKGLDYKRIVRAVRENAKGEPDPNGELTYPERFNEKVLEEIHKTVGDYMFSALMLSLPLKSKDAMFRDEDILDYEDAPRDLLIFTTVDPASYDQKGIDPDYNVVLTAGVSLTGQGIYVLDYFRARCPPGEVIDEVFGQVERFHPLRVGVESVAYQKTLKWWIEEQQNKRRFWFNVDEISASRAGTPARIRGLQPIVANRQIHIRPWMTALRQEFVAFPRGAHDDLIAALSFQLEYWQHAETLLDSSASDVTERFTGAHVLEELWARSQRGVGYPYDLMGVTKDGQDLFSRENFPMIEAFSLGGGRNHVIYSN